ncbi:MAG: class I SAM-dependent methyltransferase [Candidatus Pacebacteria bacterium]|nr:class I SAM-dependent methyltransferase [Candidatus Paceibacterota bacterium]
MLKQLIARINKSYFIHKLVQPLRTFRFQNKQYHYFCHKYNSPHINERAVELPIAWAEVQKYQSSEVLEVGNVLSHYFPISHQVVDKYEVAPGVINKDVINFKSSKKFKLIVSISTLEHVGWDEKVKNKQKIPRALEHLKSLLAPGGTVFITLPLGYNLYLDEHLRTNKIAFDKAFFLQRKTVFNSWLEVDKRVLKKMPKYNYPFANANVIIIGKLRAK